MDSAHSYVEQTKQKLSDHVVMRHPFLTWFGKADLDLDGLRRFAIQWYKTARGHKRAFPAVVLNTIDDNVRFDLIEILREEYGSGDRNHIHARLLLRFLSRLELSEEEVDAVETIPEVQRFSDEVLRIWRDAHPAEAFGLHFALEYLAASLHASLANGLARYPFLQASDRIYFEYHKTAEPHHSHVSENGLRIYAQVPENRLLLAKGVNTGATLISELYDGYVAHIYRRGAQLGPLERVHS